ncbi:LOW QUALITY PROTEIN: uncharacterized protein LOC122353892 [Puntigrus tetrazona]|uniref:LOW QUALITY PROTEIN: uncharacterized protein LOC122353892 n=1 Tax=Puntigrus tetrazona TaxID=1606681 RepID=UPI001C89AECC|nr:LOW QUALITY PROTEIN: uncharacterized protein LOC122353892 [Puntigrus tetrazona]
MSTVGVDVIEAAALGRSFRPGMLYDCRKDALVPGIALWGPEKLQQSLQTRPQNNTDIKVTASDSIEDKSAVLNIDGSLKLSLLGGLVKVTGAAKYLNDTKKSFRQKRLTLHYHSACRFEELSINRLAPEDITVDDDAATHVVTAVLYGADACFVFDREVSPDEDQNAVEGEAKLALEKLRFISADGNASPKTQWRSEAPSPEVTCTFYGDVQLPSNPASFEEALKVFADLPTLLGEKKALAVPVRVWLHPLNKLRSRAFADVGVDLIAAVESAIESLNTAEMRCGDLLKDSPALTFTAFRDKIIQMQENCASYKTRLAKRLGSLLPSIRGGLLKETALNDLLQEHRESPFRRSELAEWLKERERESEIVKSVLRQLQDAGARADVDVDVMLMDLEVENVVCFVFTSLGRTDALLLQQKACLSPSEKDRNNDNRSGAKRTSWLSPEIRKAMRRNLKTFKSLIDSEDRKPARFIVSSSEMENNPGSCVLLYESECDEAVCFTPPSKPSCPVTEEVKENSVSLKVPPACSSTEELRLLCKAKQDSVWKSKAVMKDENTVTLTDLRAGTEYEMVCAAVGKLNYTVYSDATEVTTEGRSSTSTEETSTGRVEATGRSQNLNALTNPDVYSIKLKPPVINPKSSKQSQSSASVSSSKAFRLRLKEEYQYLNGRQNLNDVFVEQLITEDPDSHISDGRRIPRQNVLEGQHIRSVLLKGDAGVGKTTAVQKFVLDWAEEKSNADIAYIFPIPFQTLNVIRETTKTCSFAGILRRCFGKDERLKVYGSERIVLIFDGLNEFKPPLDFKSAKTITDKNQPASVSCLLANVIAGNLFPNAQIWITSRPAAVKQIPDAFIDRVTEIHGFTDLQKKEYFGKSIRDQATAGKVIGHIQKSRRIESMCHLPDYCRIVAAIPEKMFRSCRDDFPKTLTQMYARLLLDQTELILERKESIVALGRIALHLLANGNALFCREHLERCGFGDEGVLARASIVKEVGDESGRKLLRFADRRAQEFLAALYATEIINVDNDLQLRDLSALRLGKYSFTDTGSLFAVIESTLERQIDLFFFFLMGLSLESSQTALKGLLTPRKRCSSISQSPVNVIKQLINSNLGDTDRCRFLFDALKELDERYLIQEIKTQLKSGLKPSPAEISALVNIEK